MDMDDPWGSPWADEAQQSHSFRPPTAEVTPKALTRAQTTAPPLSPWGDDDDGFGDWAEPPNNGDTLGEWLSLPGASKSWDRKGSGEGGSRHQDRTWDQPDIATITHTTGVQDLAPVLLSKTSELLRPSSPDPWASATPDFAVPEPELLGKIPDATVSLETSDTSMSPTKDLARSNGSTSLPTACPTKTGTNESPDPQSHIHNQSADNIPEDVTTSSKNISNSVPPVTDRGSSRPSTSPSEYSYPDEISSESPRTSLDEPKRPIVSKHMSNKIQELVEHFDGLAKVEVVEGIPSTGERKSQPVTQGDAPEPIHDETHGGTVNDNEEEEKTEEVDDDDFGDFGEFEEGSDGEDSSTPFPEISRPVTPAKVVPTRRVPKDFGRVDFRYDVSQLDTLFDLPSEEPSSPVFFVPDVIPHDSFTTVEERKTWYRVSRYGTMRKHNIGDDENYIRVNWRKSSIRNKTLKIVGQWMAEDRVSGRVVLGGGSKGSSIFGWNDKTAAPVSVDSAFASKHKTKKSDNQVPVEGAAGIPREWKGLIRSRSTSKTRSPSSKLQRRSSSKTSKTPKDVKPQAQLQSKQPIASFGWSESQPDTEISVPISLVSEASSSLQAITSAKTPTPSNIIVPSKVPDASAETSLRAPSILSPIVGTPMTPYAPVSVNTNGLWADKRVQETSNSLATVTTPITITPDVLTSSNTLDPWADLSGQISTKPLAVVDKPTLAQLATSNIAIDDDDDEWGEMVSTPETPVLPILSMMPGSMTLRHKKSRSFNGNDFSKHSVASSVNNSRQVSFDISSRSTNSLDIPRITDVVKPPKADILSLAFGTSNTSSARNSSTSDFNQPSAPTIPITVPVVTPSVIRGAPKAIDLVAPPADVLSLAFGTSSTNSARSSLANDYTQISAQTTEATISSSPDTWASVDFSFFDTPPTSSRPTYTPAHNSLTKMVSPRNATSAPPASQPRGPTPSAVSQRRAVPGMATTRHQGAQVSKPTPLKEVAFATQPSSAATPTGGGRSRLETEQDAIVAGIIKGLPDLSYMLRR